MAAKAAGGVAKEDADSKDTGTKQGSELHDDDVLVLECDDDTFEVAVMLLEREAKGDGAIERIQEELQQNISIEWLQKAIREEEERLTTSQRMDPYIMRWEGNEPCSP